MATCPHCYSNNHYWNCDILLLILSLSMVHHYHYHVADGIIQLQSTVSRLPRFDGACTTQLGDRSTGGMLNSSCGGVLHIAKL